MTRTLSKELDSPVKEKSDKLGAEAKKAMARGHQGIVVANRVFMFAFAMTLGLWRAVKGCGPTSPCCTLVSGTWTPQGACLSCNGIECTSCSSGFLVSAYNCCSPNFTADICSSSCIAFNEYYYRGTCRTSGTTNYDNCARYRASNQCRVCEANYWLDSDNICRPMCSRPHQSHDGTSCQDTCPVG